MISHETASAAMEVAARAKALGKSLSPKLNAPLAILCRNTDLSLTTDETAAMAEVVATECFDSNNMLVQAGERLAAGTDTTHDNYQDAFTEQIGKAVVKHIAYVHGDILPQVREFTQRVQSTLGAIDVNTIAHYNVREITLPSGLQSEAFQNDLDRKTTGRLINPQGKLKVFEESFDYMALLKTGSKAFDDDAQHWFSSSLVTMFTWGAFFDTRVLNEMSNTVTSSTEQGLKDLIRLAVAGNLTVIDAVTNSVYGGEIAFALYLFAQGLSKATLTAPQHDETEFKRLIDQYQDAAGSRLLQYTKQWAAAIKGGELIKYTNSTQGVMHVYSESFQTYLQMGGTQEALLGRMVLGSRQQTVQDVLDAKEVLSKAWSSFVTSKATERRMKHFSVALQTIQSVFYGLMAEKQFSPMEQSYLDTHPGHFERVSASFDEKLKDVTLEDVDALEDTCCRLLCETRFGYTNAHQFFRYMKEAFAANEGISPREAAEQAKIQYVIDFVLSQIEVA